MATNTMTAGEVRRARSPVRSKLMDAASRWAFMAPAAIILAAMLAYPNIYTVEISFARFDLMTFSAVEFVGWENYAHVFDDYRFWSSMRVTLIYLAFALPIQIVLGFGIAYLINAPWRGRGAVRALFIIPMVVAPVVAGGIWRMILDPLWGIMNWVAGLFGVDGLDWFGDPTLAMASIIIIDTWRWTPFVILIATAALLALPRDIFEAAEIDGANWWSMLWSITLPLLNPITLIVVVLNLVYAMQSYEMIYLITNGGPSYSTNTVGLLSYNLAFGTIGGGSAQFGTAAAVTWTLTLGMALVYVAARLVAHARRERSMR